MWRDFARAFYVGMTTFAASALRRHAANVVQVGLKRCGAETRDAHGVARWARRIGFRRWLTARGHADVRVTSHRIAPQMSDHCHLASVLLIHFNARFDHPFRDPRLRYRWRAPATPQPARDAREGTATCWARVCLHVAATFLSGLPHQLPTERFKTGNKPDSFAVIHVKPTPEASPDRTGGLLPESSRRTLCRRIFLPSRRAATP